MKSAGYQSYQGGIRVEASVSTPSVCTTTDFRIEIPKNFDATKVKREKLSVQETVNQTAVGPNALPAGRDKTQKNNCKKKIQANSRQHDPFHVLARNDTTVPCEDILRNALMYTGGEQNRHGFLRQIRKDAPQKVEKTRMTGYSS